MGLEDKLSIKKKNRFWLAVLSLAVLMQLDVIVTPVFSKSPFQKTQVNNNMSPVAIQPKGMLSPPEPSGGIHETIHNNLTNNPSPLSLPVGQMIPSIPAMQGNKKVVYLTFDDGPNEYTRQIVNILNENHIKGTFFWVGQNVQDVQLAQEMVREGHVIGTHTMDHSMMRNKTRQQQIQMIQKSTDYVSKKIGSPIYYFRPPYGAVDSNTLAASVATGEILISWNVDTLDWMNQNNQNAIIYNIHKEVQPGSIILMHEKPHTTEYLPKVIKLLRDMGYDFLPLPAPKGTPV